MPSVWTICRAQIVNKAPRLTKLQRTIRHLGQIELARQRGAFAAARLVPAAQRQKPHPDPFLTPSGVLAYRDANGISLPYIKGLSDA